VVVALAASTLVDLAGSEAEARLRSRLSSVRGAHFATGP